MNIQDIIKDREIIKMKNQYFGGLSYESWKVQIPIFNDVIEKLLESGFSVSVLEPNLITVIRQLNASPKQLQQNKRFWRELAKTLGEPERGR